MPFGLYLFSMVYILRMADAMYMAAFYFNKFHALKQPVNINYCGWFFETA